jgi:hypothetical protein
VLPEYSVRVRPGPEYGSTHTTASGARKELAMVKFTNLIETMELDSEEKALNGQKF